MAMYRKKKVKKKETEMEAKIRWDEAHLLKRLPGMTLDDLFREEDKIDGEAEDWERMPDSVPDYRKKKASIEKKKSLVKERLKEI